MRRLVTLAFSLTFTLLLLALWLRSHLVHDTVWWSTTHTNYSITSAEGRILHTTVHWPSGCAAVPLTFLHVPARHDVRLVDLSSSDGFRLLGFEYAPTVIPSYAGNFSFYVPPSRNIAIPYWVPFALAVLHPLARGFGPLRRHQRLRRGLCPACAYDCRATPGRCPECGVKVHPT